MPLTPDQFRANLIRRFAESAEEDEQAAATIRGRLPEAVRLIVERLGPRKVVLYGSLATGLFRAAYSDVDLAVTGLGWEAPPDLCQSLRHLLGPKVDLVDPALVTPYVREAIERGEVLGEPH